MTEVETYGQEGGIMKKHKRHIMLMVFVAFVAVFGLLIYTSFGHLPFGITLTGNSVQNPSLISENGIKINAVLTVPSINLKGSFNQLQITGGSSANFYAGTEKFFLGKAKENYITLANYSGKISFNEKIISELNGNSQSILMNGVQVNPNSKSTLNVYTDKNLDYSELYITSGVEIKNLDYNTTGTISINDGENIFNLQNQEVILRNFNGGISVENNKIKLAGYAESINVLGEHQISVS